MDAHCSAGVVQCICITDAEFARRLLVAFVVDEDRIEQLPLDHRHRSACAAVAANILLIRQPDWSNERGTFAVAVLRCHGVVQQ